MLTAVIVGAKSWASVPYWSILMWARSSSWLDDAVIDRGGRGAGGEGRSGETIYPSEKYS